MFGNMQSRMICFRRELPRSSVARRGGQPLRIARAEGSPCRCPAFGTSIFQMQILSLGWWLRYRPRESSQLAGDADNSYLAHLAAPGELSELPG